MEEPEARSELCREILTALPDWFGIEEAVDAYVRDVAGLPTFAAAGSREGRAERAALQLAVARLASLPGVGAP